jgi:mannitol/fructose-specific phosphotransferase system IIA component (Ntr-type)
MLERNRLGETPADAGVALPHLLLNDVDDFHLVAVRSIRGIDFPMAKQPIHAAFMLLGSRRNPTQHLRFLAEIARRAESPTFIDDWISAKSASALSALLLANPNEADT